MKSYKSSRKISAKKSMRSRKYRLKSKKRALKKSIKKRGTKTRSRHQKGGFLGTVKNFIESQVDGPKQNTNVNSSKQVLLNTMCDNVDDKSLLAVPKLSGIVSSLCLENAKDNSMKSMSMSGGNQSNNLGGIGGTSGVIGMVVNAATYPARMGLNVIKNVTGFHGGNILNSGNSGKQELVGGDVRQNINMIKANNKAINSLKAVPQHILDPGVYDNIQSLNSLEIVPN